MKRPRREANVGQQRYFTVKDFERLQYRSDKQLPWVKLYCNLLNDPAFERLPDAAKWHYCGLLLLARKSDRFDHSLPWEPSYLQRKLALSEPLDLDFLARARFISPVKKQRKPKKQESESGAQSADSERPTERTKDALDRDRDGDRDGDGDGEESQLNGLENLNLGNEVESHPAAQKTRDLMPSLSNSDEEISPFHPEPSYETSYMSVEGNEADCALGADLLFAVTCLRWSPPLARFRIRELLSMNSEKVKQRSPQGAESYLDKTMNLAEQIVNEEAAICDLLNRDSGDGPEY